MVEVRRSRPVANGNGEADGSTDSADASEAGGAEGEEGGLLPFLPEWAPLGPPSGDPNHSLQAAPPRPPGRSLAEYAYHALRDVLREGRFKPGEHLPETDIARWLSISRTPVREAMQKLRDSLVRFQPQIRFSLV